MKLFRSQMVFLIIGLFAATVAFAGKAKPPKTPDVPVAQAPSTNPLIPAPPPIDAKGYALVDATTGQMLAGYNSDIRMPPASLTKLMTLYLIAEALHNKRIHLDDLVTVSEKAWRTGGSRMFIQVGTQVPVKDLIQGIAVVSGNDACVAMAEHIAGTEEAFTDLMNQTAVRLGMKNSHYTDASGLPNSEHFTTPQDLAILAHAIINDFPEYYHWYRQQWFEYNGIKQPNRDILLWRDPSIEGMKTGHTQEAGYCLVTSAKRNDTRLISVIMASSSPKARANASLALVNYGFRFYQSKKVFDANSVIQQPRAWFSKNKYTRLGVLKDFYVTVPAAQSEKLKAVVAVNHDISAPVAKGQVFGVITVFMKDKEIAKTPLVALEDNPKGGIFTRTKDHIVHFFMRIFHST